MTPMTKASISLECLDMCRKFSVVHAIVDPIALIISKDAFVLGNSGHESLSSCIV